MTMEKTTMDTSNANNGGKDTTENKEKFDNTEVISDYPVSEIKADAPLVIPSIENVAFNATIAAFENLKVIAEYLAKSDTFAKDFEVKDKDGNVQYDEETGISKKNVADIAFSLMAGRELGLDLTGSLLLGKKLNSNTYLAIFRGRGMGIDAATSMEKIYSIPTKNGRVSYTGVDIISAKLLQGGVEFLPFIRDYAPLYQYKVVSADGKNFSVIATELVEDAQGVVKDKYFVVTPDKTAVELQSAKDAGKVILVSTEIGKITTAVFKRQFGTKTQTLVVSYDTIKAQTAGLLASWNAEGKLVDAGKDNWNYHAPTMLRNRVISIGGRIIGADLINGMYSEDEANELKSRINNE